jgi:rhamnosyltransferase
MKNGTLAFSVVVPTLNAAKDWPQFSDSLLRCVDPQAVLIVDSDSDDNTAQLASDAGFQLLQIERSSFNHGGTRQLAADCLPDSDVIVYMTQDAVLANSQAVSKLIEPFEDEGVAAAFGRQLPQADAGPIAAHARLFNYPAVSSLRSVEKSHELGLKTIFFSNSFGAYRRSALQGVGGFPKDVIFGEDTVTVARLLLHGWKVAYVAEAEAYHSHEYTPVQDFKRYFDIGVLHSREAWLLDKFGGATGEGRRFVLSEIAHLWPWHCTLIPSAVIRSALKLAGYHAGRMEDRISASFKQRLSMHRFFWTEFDQAELRDF